jgi:flagellar hook-associated protein 1 FlgK
MSGSVDALQSAISGLNVSQQLLNITAQNAANAQTAGYTKKSIIVSDQVAGGNVVGTVIGNVQRTVDTGIQKTYWQQVSNSGNLSTTNSYLSQLQTLYGTSDAQTSFSSYLSQLNDDFTSLSSTPDSSTQQLQTVSDAQTFANSLNTTASTITTLRNNTQTDISSAVASINTNLQTIATVNNEIAQATYAGQSTAALEDQRDTAVTSLAAQINITYYTNTSGVMVVQDGNGDTLADTQAHQLVFNQQSVGDKTAYPATLSGVYIDNSTTGVDLAANESKVGGTLGSLLTLRDQILPQAQAQVDQLALQTANRFQAQGLTLFTNPDGTIPSSPSGPLTSDPSVGFASSITVNPAVVANPALVQQGTTAQTPALDPGDNTIIDKVLNYTFGANADASGTPNTPFTTTGLGMNGNISLTGFEANDTLENFAQQALSIQATQASNSTSQQTASDNYRDALQQTLSNNDGVNLDTEVSNLTVYEHSYAAAAQVITTVNQLMTDLMNAVSSGH